MMRLATLIVAVLLPSSVVADDSVDVENRKNLLIKRLDLQKLELGVIANELSIAESRKKIALLLSEAAKADSETESTKRLLGLPNIEVHNAFVEVVSEPSRVCFAVDFIRYYCHRAFECNFDVDEKVCALPGPKTQPMTLKVNYSCGTQIRDVAVPVGQRAYITCR